MSDSKTQRPEETSDGAELSVKPWRLTALALLVLALAVLLGHPSRAPTSDDAPADAPADAPEDAPEDAPADAPEDAR